MVFMNMTESIGIILGNATTHTTGSMFLTLLMVLIIIMAIALMFGIKLEFTIILVLPLVLSYMAFYSEFVATGMILLFYIGFLITKNFLFK